MNKFTFFTLLSFTCCFAKPLYNDQTATILRSENNLNEDNTGYSFSFETSNGIKRSETGKNFLIGKDQNGEDVYEVLVTGYYEYLDENGKIIRTDYQSDQNGFTAYGDHLPVPSKKIQSQEASNKKPLNFAFSSLSNFNREVNKFIGKNY